MHSPMRVMEAAVEIPTNTTSPAVKEMQRQLHRLALEYAGEMPGQDVAAYTAWRLRLESFKYMVTNILARQELPR